MYDAGRLNHTTWDCKYHIVWIPKYRRKLLYGSLRKYLGEVFRELSILPSTLIALSCFKLVDEISLCLLLDGGPAWNL